MLRQMMMLALMAGLVMPGTPASADGPILGIKMTTPESGGALITEVIPGSSAEKLGLKPGYVIVAMGTHAIRNTQDVVDAVRATPVGYWETIVYGGHKQLRAGLYVVGSSTVGRLPPRGAIGVEIADHTLGIRGARVDGVQPEGPAWQAGLRAGDIIVAVGGVDIGGSDDLIRRIANRSGLRTELTLYRNRRYYPAHVTPSAVSQTGALEIQPEEANGAEVASSSRGDHWCDQSTIRLTLCVTVGVAAAVVALGMLMEGDATRPDMKASDSPKTKPSDIQRDYERASEQSEIQRRAFPN